MRSVFFLWVLVIAMALPSYGRPAKVIRIIDGDTFVIETGERVRIIGINAPEMKTVYGEPAKIHLAMLIGGKYVDLENDHISAEKDMYGRLLRYVYVGDVDIDKQMVTDGYAVAFVKYRFDKAAEYKQQEANAKKANLGIWQNNGRDIYLAKQGVKPTKARRKILFLSKAVIVTLFFLAIVVPGVLKYLKW